MIRQKRRQLLVTFPSTTEAMKMEREAGLNNISGRIIPLPTQVSAGCGLAWKTELSYKEDIIEFARKVNIKWENMLEMDLF